MMTNVILDRSSFSVPCECEWKALPALSETLEPETDLVVGFSTVVSLELNLFHR